MLQGVRGLPGSKGEPGPLGPPGKDVSIDGGGQDGEGYSCLRTD